MSGSERDDKGDGIQVDVYGIKASIQPTSGDENEPRSWRAVAQAINADLRSITVGIFRLLKVTLHSSINLVRGIGEIPGAAAERIKGAHSRADEAEHVRQLAAPSSVEPSTSGKESALQQVKAILDRKQVQGMTVRTYSDGQRIVICVVKPTDEAAVEEIARASLAAASEKALIGPGDE